MDLGPFFVGQVPLKPLTITVNGVNLDEYGSVDVVMQTPVGEGVDTAGSTQTVSGDTLTWHFPPVSIFTSPGDYRLQVRLSAPDGALDYTTTARLAVQRPLESN